MDVADQNTDEMALTTTNRFITQYYQLHKDFPLPCTSCGRAAWVFAALPAEIEDAGYRGRYLITPICSDCTRSMHSNYVQREMGALPG